MGPKRMQDFIVGLEMGKVYHKMTRCIDAMMSEVSGEIFTSTNARVLCYIIEAGDSVHVVQRDIEQFLGVRRSTVSVILTNMQQHGLILRQSVASDARLKRIVPTQKAYELHEKLSEIFVQMEDTLKKNLTPGQLMVFYEALQGMDQNLDHI